ncbi:Glutamine--tRNA ligase [Chromobacterium vaccinii]|nr:Glutamine--tRNA ligase [Chromobacterium vaccinii]
MRGDDGEYVDFRQFLSQESLKLVPAYVEASVLQAAPESRFQFERLGYFVTDRYEHRKGDKAVFNRTVGLKDSWK